MPGSLNGQCHTALETLLASSRAVGKGAKVQKVAVPYFGALSIERRQGGHADAGSYDRSVMETVLNKETPGFDGSVLDLSLDDLLWAYQGPWIGYDEIGFLSTEGDPHVNFHSASDGFWAPQ